MVSASEIANFDNGTAKNIAIVNPIKSDSAKDAPVQKLRAKRVIDPHYIL